MTDDTDIWVVATDEMAGRTPRPASASKPAARTRLPKTACKVRAVLRSRFKSVQEVLEAAASHSLLHVRYQGGGCAVRSEKGTWWNYWSWDGTIVRRPTTVSALSYIPNTFVCDACGLQVDSSLLHPLELRDPLSLSLGATYLVCRKCVEVVT